MGQGSMVVIAAFTVRMATLLPRRTMTSAGRHIFVTLVSPDATIGVDHFGSVYSWAAVVVVEENDAAGGGAETDRCVSVSL